MVNADKHPKGIAAKLLAERVNNEMQGKACMEVFPNSALYNDDKVLEAMLRSDVQLAAPSLSKFETFTKKFRLFDLPFVFVDINASAVDVSIGRMFLAGVIPGLIAGLMLMGGIIIASRLVDLPSQPRATWSEFFSAASDRSIAPKWMGEMRTGMLAGRTRSGCGVVAGFPMPFPGSVPSPAHQIVNMIGFLDLSAHLSSTGNGFTGVAFMRVVLVDDDCELRVLLHEGLCVAGHAVTAFEGSKAALAHILAERPDIVVTDIVMEDGEGIGLITELRLQCPQLPVIAMSGQQQYLDIAAGFGVQACLLKPFRVGRLLETLAVAS